MNFKLLLAFLSISVLPRIWSTDPPRPVSCVARTRAYPDGVNKTEIRCTNVGIDGKSLDDTLFQATYLIHGAPGRTYTFSEVAPIVNHLHVIANGNVKITGSAFVALPNLGYIEIDSYNVSNQLIVNREGFESMPNVTGFYFTRLTFAESTVEALHNWKGQMDTLAINLCTPGQKILKEVAKFTALTTKARINGLCENEDFPADTFKNSASTLKMIEVLNCKLTKITKTMFQGMSNLFYLNWRNSSITTIEPQAFDDLVNLEVLVLRENQIRYLPAGLFSNNKKLKEVYLQGNGVENLSRENFTHCEHFQTLKI